MYCSTCKLNMISELMYAAEGTNTGLSQYSLPRQSLVYGLVWFGKCTRQKGFFDQQKVQRRKEDYWKIAFQNQHGEIRQNGRIDHLHVFPWWRTNAYKQ